MQAIRIVLAVAAVTGLAAFTAITVGGTEASPAVSGDPPSRAAWPGGLPEHAGAPVDTAAAPARALAVAASSRLRIRTFNSRDFTLAAQDSIRFVMTCPRGWRAINAYYAADTPGLVFSTFELGRAGTRWVFGALNLNSTTSITYYTGVMCARGFTS